LQKCRGHAKNVSEKKNARAGHVGKKVIGQRLHITNIGGKKLMATTGEGNPVKYPKQQYL